MDRKRGWAATVYEQLREGGLLVDGNRLVYHAGRDYYGELLPLLNETGVKSGIPTEGPRYGEIPSWYTDQL